MNVMMLLEMASAAFPERLAFTDGSTGVSFTYQRLFDAARSRGYYPGQWREPPSEIRCQQFGHATELVRQCVGWRALCTLELPTHGCRNSGLLARVTPAYLVTDAERVAQLGATDDVNAASTQSFLDDTQHDHGIEDPWAMDPEDIAVLLFTSGTTGEPKAAVLRHKHLVSYILGSVEFAGAQDSDAALVCVPPYHIAGIAAIMSSVYSGRHVVQLPNFTAEAWIELARKYKISTAFVVPTMLARIVECLEAEGVSDAQMPHLSSLSYGGGKMPLSVIEKAMTLFPDTDFSNAYGLTETSSTICVLGPEEHRQAAAASTDTERRRLVSVGRPLPGVEIEIRDEDGHQVSAGERGEIYVRGEQVSGEYEGRGSVTDSDGWFPTRDAGSLDEEGYLFLEGRADDVIVRGGENLSLRRDRGRRAHSPGNC